ncbi:unnamed protein product [Linum tenue]|uniref:TF-B3 domain-containing protein n=1 Tax=Linum tenue TaxID=586396 RepID=A0AAV0MMH3_9ROSI|nr:unnamed protein product [Linum tenue]
MAMMALRRLSSALKSSIEPYRNGGGSLYSMSSSTRLHSNRTLTAAEGLARTASGRVGDLLRRLLASGIETSTKFSTSFLELPPESKKSVKKAIDCHDPKNPSVLIVMMKSHVSPGILSLPGKFARKYFPAESQRVTLCAYEGKKRRVGEWRADASRRWRSEKQETLYFRRWGGFRADNELVVGDVCLFELIDKKRKIFNVHILRAWMNKKNQ